MAVSSCSAACWEANIRNLQDHGETFAAGQGSGNDRQLGCWGLYLVVDVGGYLSDGDFWAHLKILLVILMSALHMRFAWHGETRCNRCKTNIQSVISVYE